MGSFGKVKSSAKVLAFIGEKAYIFFVKTDVNRPIPALIVPPKLFTSGEAPMGSGVRRRW